MWVDIWYASTFLYVAHAILMLLYLLLPDIWCCDSHWHINYLTLVCLHLTLIIDMLLLTWHLMFDTGSWHIILDTQYLTPALDMLYLIPDTGTWYVILDTWSLTLDTGHRHLICITWHLISDTWNLTPALDMLYLTPDLWYLISDTSTWHVITWHLIYDTW